MKYAEPLEKRKDVFAKRTTMGLTVIYVCSMPPTNNNKLCLVKPIEHAARFNGDGFIEFSSEEFPHISSEQVEIIKLRFRTNSSNGVRTTLFCLLWSKH